MTKKQIEKWSKVTVVLLHRQVANLDMLSHDIRLKHRKRFTRAELIRALIEAAFQSGADLSEATSEQSLGELAFASKKKR